MAIAWGKVKNIQTLQNNKVNEQKMNEWMNELIIITNNPLT